MNSSHRHNTLTHTDTDRQTDNIAFIHHEGRHTIIKVEKHKKTYNETQKYTMNIQAKIQKI